MELYSSNEYYKLYEGNMLDMLSVLTPNSIDSIVTDPPYELNFMNKSWDNTGIAFQPTTWKKCYDVLKPGGYLLAFGGSRTYHRIACAIEDAGFEIRDTIMWLYGSGFPKSMNISKQIDKRNGRNEKEFKKLGNYLKEKIIDTDNICAEKIGFSPALVRFWKLGERIPNKETWIKLKSIYGLDSDFDWLIEREEAEREVIGKKEYTADKNVMNIRNYTGERVELNITIPSTEEAKQWDGWGSCLKPAYEPIIVARKPLDGTLVDNVLKWGVGGINIDECRVGTETISTHNAPVGTFAGGEYDRGSDTSSYKEHEGRFPANLILTYDDSDFEEVCGGFPIGGKNGSINNEIKNTTGESGIYSSYGDTHLQYDAYNDSGSASRYFYCAKASKRDRDEGLDGEVKINLHPTVKPTDLLSYLIRLVTPNGGTILDPFNGSGSTGKAAMYENKDNNKDYKYIGIELTLEYLPISKARIEFVCNGGITLDKEENNGIIDNVKTTTNKGRQYAFTWGN